MASKYMSGTLPDHEWCTTHRSHKLGCHQYEQLLARSGGQCEICRRPSTECPRGKLAIDHFGRDWAVRGLLCSGCNTSLTTEVTEANHPWAADYLANSWWEKECERLGVPTTLAPEPDYGSAIRDQFNVVWMRESDGEWRPSGHGRPGISSASWAWLYRHRGPHNMALLDLDGSDGDQHGLWRESERHLLRGTVRVIGGVEMAPRGQRKRWPRPPVEDYWSVA